MRIQTRDRDLLAGLLKYGILSTRLIGQNYFQNLHHTTLMRRLRILERATLIIRSDALPNGMCAWTLGAIGAKALVAEAPARYTNRNTMLHDVAISELRIALESVGISKDFTSERELKSQAGWEYGSNSRDQSQIPDGLFVEKLYGKANPAVVALEVELHAKSLQRYARIIYEYLHTPEINYVWYVVQNKAIANVICSLLKKQKQNRSLEKFIFSDLRSVIELKTESEIMIGSSGAIHRLDQFFDLPRLEPKQSAPIDHPLGNQEMAEVGSS